MREQFISKAFKPEAESLIEICNRTIRDYLSQGLRLTLRQLYYQCVTRNVITNEERSYKRLGKLVSDARLAGLMDWDAIEDRGRQPRSASSWDTLSELVETACDSFRLPRWNGQDHYVELWVEKDALAGVLEPLAREAHVTLMVNKGYSSQSAMYAASKRYLEHGEGKFCKLFYLGDHDPSGEDMVRDIQARLNLFCDGEASVDVEKLALTMAQIRRYKPPPNPAKMTDSRASRYVAEHGASSWEVDALPPNVLAKIIRDAFAEVIDRERMDAIIDREERLKDRLREACEEIENDDSDGEEG